MTVQEQYTPHVTYHTVTLGPLTRGGDAQAEITIQDDDGATHMLMLPVPAGLPGERVTIAYEPPPPPRSGRRRKHHRHHYKLRPPRVWITAIHQASPLRVQAPCPVFGTCGGCQLQHMRYEAQLEWKREVVRQLLHERGFSDPPLLPTEPCDPPWNYRNHMRFSVNREGQAGLTARNSHRVLPLRNCPIAHEQINRALIVLSQQQNVRPQVLIRCATHSGQMLIQPQQSPKIVEQLTAVGLAIQTETMEEQLAGETFRIRPSSFFQTNTVQAEKMIRMVLAGLLPSNHPAQPAQAPLTVVDAYCGVGTFALLLAKWVSRVIAIEESASAIKDARWNLRNANNVDIIQGKVEDRLPELAAQLDGLVIDPPRAGCQPAILDALAHHPVKRIVYVSCDPATLARDLDILCHQYQTYRLQSIQPLDMFPQTAHIENIAVLEHRN
jgi:23S rRNA (uracil1939-C5)-methyltransferase